MEEKGKISVVINTYNAEKHLKVVVEAVKDFDEVLVCDMESTDSTLAIAREMGCRIVTFPKNGVSIVEPAREFAIHEAANEWVLVVDADEIVTPQLKDYLYRRIKEADCPDGIAIPRKNYFMGRFMHSCYPDNILRFFRKEVTHWPPVIHTSPVVEGRVERIPKKHKELAFEHLANDSVADILRKNNTYSDYEVVRRRHKRYGIGALIGKPLFRFFKSYFLKGGCLDGIPGLIHAKLDSMYQFTIVAKLMEERRTKGE
jgi:glycosyltransferase involved in cell wall biosynthesis